MIVKRFLLKLLKPLLVLFGVIEQERNKEAERMVKYIKRVTPLFMKEKLSEGIADKTLLVSSCGWYDVKTEGVYAKTLESAGYAPHAVIGSDSHAREMFEMYRFDSITDRNELIYEITQEKLREAAGLIEDKSEEEILNLSIDGVNVGRHSAATFLRRSRRNRFNLDSEEKKGMYIDEMARSLRAMRGARALMEKVNPDLLLMNDRGTTPHGELFDLALNNGIPVITRNSSQKSGWEVLKKYSSAEMGTYHPLSLSKESWEYIKNRMPWGDEEWNTLYGDISRSYISGDWFAEVGAQFNKKVYSRDVLDNKLRLDKNKKTAVIFPHIFWDGTFFWGEDLFNDYYEWFVHVIRVAAENKDLNWIIKIHPANMVKATRDNYKGESEESKAIYQTIGELPGHMRLIEHGTDINTFGLYGLMDYCLTVRGTVGIEATAFGVRTLTAGTGRYNNLGFTRDFTSKEEYLDCLRSLGDVESMSDEETQLARRYAYGVFYLRPIRLDLLEHGYNRDAAATQFFRPLYKTREEFESYTFANELREFVKSGREDYLNKAI